MLHVLHVTVLPVQQVFRRWRIDSCSCTFQCTCQMLLMLLGHTYTWYKMQQVLMLNCACSLCHRLSNKCSIAISKLCVRAVADTEEHTLVKPSCANLQLAISLSVAVLTACAGEPISAVELHWAHAAAGATIYMACSDRRRYNKTC